MVGFEMVIGDVTAGVAAASAILRQCGFEVSIGDFDVEVAVSSTADEPHIEATLAVRLEAVGGRFRRLAQAS